MDGKPWVALKSRTFVKMKINKYTIAGLFILVLSALGYLLYIQFEILDRDIQTNKEVMQLSLPDILSDLYDNMMFNEGLREHTDSFVGTDDFSFNSESTPSDPLQRLLKQGLDEVLALNYPDLEHELDGFGIRYSTSYIVVDHVQR